MLWVILAVAGMSDESGGGYAEEYIERDIEKIKENNKRNRIYTAAECRVNNLPINTGRHYVMYRGVEGWFAWIFRRCGDVGCRCQFITRGEAPWEAEEKAKMAQQQAGFTGQAAGFAQQAREYAGRAASGAAHGASHIFGMVFCGGCRRPKNICVCAEQKTV